MEEKNKQNKELFNDCNAIITLAIIRLIFVVLIRWFLKIVIIQDQEKVSEINKFLTKIPLPNE
jgi:hypothetical protein